MTELEHDAAMAIWRAAHAQRGHDPKRCLFCRKRRARRRWHLTAVASKWAFILLVPALLLWSRFH